MGGEHLDTIPATESDEVIKSSVKDLVPIQSKSEGVPKMYDVPLCENTSPLNALNEHSEIVVDSNDDNSSNDILREKLLNVNLLIAKIDALRDNPTLSSEGVIKSTSTFPNLFLEEANTFDNSIPEFETVPRFNLKEISSGSPTNSYLSYHLSLPI
ncbi:hypothetical protein Tco_0070598 [Tanacetum coccineum]